MSLSHECKIMFLLHKKEISVADFFDSVSSYTNSNKLGHSGDDFVLLSLIVHDGDLRFV